MLKSQTKPRSIWLILMALSLFSTFVAEGSKHALYAIGAVFIIAAVKGDLVIIHYMEARHAAPHWRFMYRSWLVAMVVLLIAGHVIG
jgi:bacteriorhodopsin